ncbi:MAG: DUF2252 domain-containing protein [Burkholderiales bacterium]|nr:MAG: DUF2252 domain-containing protein [Burkholderiales bacterium]
MNVNERIAQYNRGRDAKRLQLKYSKMRSDPFVFLRGACHLFYDRLPSSGIFKNAPPVWSCGDLHLENFGSYKGDNRLVYFDLNDFDEGLLAPASWDVVRMLTSLRVGSKSLDIPVKEAQGLCEAFLQAYGAALSAGKAYWIERLTAEGLIRDLLLKLRDRQRKDLLAARAHVKNRQRKLRLIDGKTDPVTAQDRARVEDFMKHFAKAQANPQFFKVLDVATRIAGTGSLGVERFVVLVEGKGSPDGNYLLDLKEALPSSLAPHVKCKQPKWPSEAHRVVAVQRRVQAVSMAFLQPVEMQGKPYVLRGLQPTEDRVSLDGARQSLSDIRTVVHAMGQLVAWGQLRSGGRQGSATADELIDFAQGQKWQGKLLDASQTCAQQTLKDFASFAQAYDEGVFKPSA